jgi:hypothetical protein
VTIRGRRTGRPSPSTSPYPYGRQRSLHCSRSIRAMCFARRWHSSAAQDGACTRVVSEPVASEPVRAKPCANIRGMRRMPPDPGGRSLRVKPASKPPDLTISTDEVCCIGRAQQRLTRTDRLARVDERGLDAPEAVILPAMGNRHARQISRQWQPWTRSCHARDI